jgi:catechol 2,3-dioxygenase-like lactoylglutathione lyase family enzyme
MRITHIELPSPDVEACLAFYRDVMQLKTTSNTVRAGWTSFDIVPATQAMHGAVHLAFNVPHHRFAAACEWIAARAMLLRDPMGEAHFHLGAPWHSASVYFAGPHDAVLELIAREPLAGEGRGWGPFHGSEIACVSEVGLPTDDVPALVRELVVRFGITPFGEGSDTFAAMGGHEGLLIVVDRARAWFPELRQQPSAAGVRVWLDAAQWELLSALQERRQRGGDQAVVVG